VTTASANEVIEVRVEDIAQLFHTLDPFPFRERDLDKEAEEYIVGWARELAANQPIKIVVHFPETEDQSKAARELGEAFRRFFAHRADGLQRDLNELFRVGRRSLAIGVLILIACLAAAHLVAGYLVEPPFQRLVEESFLILGWVANWRPLEIFLYDWWPLARRRDLYRRLAAATLESKPYPAAELIETTPEPD
jgi:ABC-type spermidine/putrescine transport system permease subunit I